MLFRSSNDTATVKNGASVTVPFLGNDEGVTGTPVINQGPAHGNFDANTGIYTPNPGFVGTDSIVYTVCNSFGKCDVAVIYIKVTRPETLDIPQGFSPQGDGVNDNFVIPGIETYPDNKITFFNRWGNVVYETKNYQNNWNGTTNSGLYVGGEALPIGTYFYILELGVSGKAPYKGYVYINK